MSIVLAILWIGTLVALLFSRQKPDIVFVKELPNTPIPIVNEAERIISSVFSKS